MSREPLRGGTAAPSGHTEDGDLRSVPPTTVRRTDFARIASLISIVVVALILTTLLNRAYQRMEFATGQTWYNRGLEALRSGHPKEAVTDLQTAILHNRDNRDYVMNLARALAAAGRQSQAKAYFNNLWQDEPGSGDINLQLARIAAQEHNIPEAEQYYHGAIYGTWETDPIPNRIAARRELIDFLLSVQKKQDAESELIALSAEAPGDSNMKTQVGDLFLLVGDPQRALQSFQEALRIDPKNPIASASAGKTAFDLGSYDEARNYLERAVRLSPSDSVSRDLLNTTSLAQSLDPFDLRLRYSERQARVLHDFDVSGARLRSCAKEKNIDLNGPDGTPLKAQATQWKELHPQLTRRGLRGNPDLLDTAANLSLDIERQTNAVCGRPGGEDLALLLIAEKRGKL